MTTLTVEQAVEEIVNTVETVEFLHGVPVNLPSQYKADLRGVSRKALQAQRDAGAREALEWVISLEDEMHSTLTIEMTNQTEMDKGYILYQDMVLNIIKLAQEKLKALTPPTK